MRRWKEGGAGLVGCNGVYVMYLPSRLCMVNTQYTYSMACLGFYPPELSVLDLRRSIRIHPAPPQPENTTEPHPMHITARLPSPLGSRPPPQNSLKLSDTRASPHIHPQHGNAMPTPAFGDAKL